MTDGKFHYEAYLDLEVEKAYVEKMLGWCLNHHDSRCRQAGQVGGFLVSWFLALHYGAKTVRTSAENLETLICLCEGTDPGMVFVWKAFLCGLYLENERLNRAANVLRI